MSTLSLFKMKRHKQRCQASLLGEKFRENFKTIAIQLGRAVKCMPLPVSLAKKE